MVGVRLSRQTGLIETLPIAADHRVIASLDARDQPPLLRFAGDGLRSRHLLLGAGMVWHGHGLAG
jgi:hypothetical protein